MQDQARALEQQNKRAAAASSEEPSGSPRRILSGDEGEVSELRAQLMRLQNAVAETKANEHKRCVSRFVTVPKMCEAGLQVASMVPICH